MCGIVGLWDTAYSLPLAEAVRAMSTSLAHRGPDNAGEFIDALAGIALGHQRLSIIDLSPSGNQPMRSRNSGDVIVYNGEVYNYRDTRKELLNRGRTFTSSSDTEVILEAFEEYGLDCVKQFRGMFAFAVWSPAQQRLRLFRDRLGVKPLYYYWDGRVFAFASELKAFHAVDELRRNLCFNCDLLPTYFQYGYFPTPHSPFAAVKKMLPGSIIEFDGSNIKETRYWEPEQFLLEGEELDKQGAWSNQSAADVQEEIECLMAEAFNLRMVSDVPVGIFLSGGYDSSLITALLSKQSGPPLNTFTLGFADGHFDESSWAREIAAHLGTNHHEYCCEPDDVKQILPRIADIIDEPFGDNSIVPTYLISKIARTQVKVALSGEGGDELFCGYNHYVMARKYLAAARYIPPSLQRITGRIVDRIPEKTLRSLMELAGKDTYNLRSRTKRLTHALKNGHSSAIDLLLMARTFVFPEDLQGMLAYGSKSNFELSASVSLLERSDVTNAMMAYDMSTYLLDDILTKIDRASMAVGLESREPLLDHSLVEYMLRLPSRYKCPRNNRKYILKNILRKYLPERMFMRPKRGFSIPVLKWFRDDLYDVSHYYLTESKLITSGILSRAEGERILGYLKNGGNNSPLGENDIWLFLSLAMWFERWQ